MAIVSAEYTESGSINVVFENQPPGMTVSVPADMSNKDYVDLLAWEAAGNTIDPYVPPPQADPPELTLEKLDARIKALESKAAAKKSAN